MNTLVIHVKAHGKVELVGLDRQITTDIGSADLVIVDVLGVAEPDSERAVARAGHLADAYALSLFCAT